MAGIPFLSDDWLRSARQAVADVTIQQVELLTIRFVHSDDDLGEVAHSQRWADGRLSDWTRMVSVEPDIEVRCELWAFYQWMFGGDCSAADLSAVDDRRRTWRLPPSPAQLATLTNLGPVAPGATIDVECTIRDHPFGRTALAYRFRDGWIREGEDQLSGKASLQLELPWAGGSEYLFGGVPFREIASRARVNGDLFALGCLTGLVAPPVMTDLHRSAQRTSRLATQAFDRISSVRHALSSLHGVTLPP